MKIKTSYSHDVLMHTSSLIHMSYEQKPKKTSNAPPIRVFLCIHFGYIIRSIRIIYLYLATIILCTLI